MALELEAPPSNFNCESCKQFDFEYRCQDCFPQAFTCGNCCLKSHRSLPFHKIEKWNGKCFVSAELRSLGLVLHLGHQGNPCPVSASEGDFEQSRSALRVIHQSGVHFHQVQYCECKEAPSRAIQLFRHRLFPATFERPETAFTFAVLDYFHIDAMECKTSASSFFSKLKRLTCSAFPQEVPVSSPLSQSTKFSILPWKDRSKELMRVSRQWRDLQTRKRFGLGHDYNGTPGPGDLALFCPTCPQPGINLPDGWKSDPDQ
jgi:hypothetical protein